MKTFDHFNWSVKSLTPSQRWWENPCAFLQSSPDFCQVMLMIHCFLYWDLLCTPCFFTPPLSLLLFSFPPYVLRKALQCTRWKKEMGKRCADNPQGDAETHALEDKLENIYIPSLCPTHTETHTEAIWCVCLWSSLSINHTLIPKVSWSPLGTGVDAR